MPSIPISYHLALQWLGLSRPMRGWDGVHASSLAGGELRSHMPLGQKTQTIKQKQYSTKSFFLLKGKINLKDRLTLSNVPELGVECRYNIALLLCCMELKGSRLYAFPKFRASILKLRVQIVSRIFFVAIETSQRF